MTFRAASKVRFAGGRKDVLVVAVFLTNWTIVGLQVQTLQTLAFLQQASNVMTAVELVAEAARQGFPSVADAAAAEAAMGGVFGGVPQMGGGPMGGGPMGGGPMGGPQMGGGPMGVGPGGPQMGCVV